jgi:hypothetical protein
MTLRFADSFDHYATADLLDKWTAAESNIGAQSISSGNGRRSSNAWTCTTTLRGLVKSVPAHATYIMGFAIDLNGNTLGTPASIIEFREVSSSSQHMVLRLNTDGSLAVRRGGTQLGASAGGVVGPTGYYFVEVKCTVNDSTGAYEVRVNGANVLSGSGADTRDGGTGVITSIALISAVNGVRIDDVYICDGAGSSNNDFLGDVRVDAFLPNGNGNSSQLAGSDGNSTDNYLLVDETAPNDDTDYVSSATASEKDTYAFANMLHTPTTIHGIQICMNARKDEGQLRSICSVIRSGGSDTDGASLALGTTYRYQIQIQETDPDTAAAWTQSGFDAAEFGCKVAV